MATDLEQLQVTLSAKADQFKQEMQSAVREFDRDANQIEQRNLQLSQSMNTSMQSASASVRLLAGALKGLFSAYAIQQFVTAIKDANTQLAQMGDTAKRLQLSTDQFQRLGFAGKTLGGLDQGDVSSGALALQQKANKEVREGEGELSRLLEANNMKLTDRAGKVKDVDTLLEMAAKLIQNARSEADKIDIANLFGLTDKWVEALEKGPVAFKNAQEEAGKVGAIIDKSIIEKAKQFDEAWNQSWSNFANRAKSAGVEAAGAVRQAWEAARDRAGFDADPKVLAQIAQQHEQGGDPALAGYFRQRSDAQARRVLAQRMTPEGQQFGPDYAGDFGNRQVVPGTGSGFAGGATLPGQVFGKTTGARTVVPKKPEKGGDALDEYDREYNSIEKQIVALTGQTKALGLVGEAAVKAEAAERLKEAADEAGLPKTAALNMEIDAQAEKLAKLKVAYAAGKLEQDLFFERSQIGRTPDEQAIASRIRGAGLDPASKDAQDLADKMRTIQNLTEGKEMAGSFVKGLVSDLENGVKAGQALENQLKRIAEKLADKAIDKLISSLFNFVPGFGGTAAVPAQSGGGWAGQGPLVNVPASAFIGARQFAAGGGIPAILHAGEIVLNQAQQKNVAQGLGPAGPINLTHAPVINGTGLSAEQVFSVIQRSQKDFARQIGPIFSDWQRRHG